METYKIIDEAEAGLFPKYRESYRIMIDGRMHAVSISFSSILLYDLI